MAGPKKIAVVLFQLGGPDSQAAVEPFLYNLFCDPDIINFPGAFLARKAHRQADLHHALQSCRPALHRNRRRLADSPPHRTASPRARTSSEAPHFRPRHRSHALLASQTLPKPSPPSTASLTTSWSCSRSIRTILSPPPAAASTNGIASTSRSTPVKIIDHFYDHPDYIAAIVERINSVLADLNQSRRNPSGFQRPRLAAGPGRKGRSLPEADRRNRATGPRTRRLAQSPRPLLPEQSRPAEVAAAIAHRHHRADGTQTASNACW